jgi:hypothetical protein
MKCFPELFLLLVLPISHALADSAYKCSMGNYDFQGVYYSDSYKVPGINGQPSCTERAAMDSEKIKEEYNTNHQMIRDQIGKMKNDPQCASLVQNLDKYLADYKLHETNFSDLTKVRTDFLVEKIKQYDVQKGFAYAGAFNGTCSGGHNRATSFLNLEFINKLPQGEGSSTQVTKEGEKVESCADVSAGGSDDLKSFFVSTKKAKGNDFLFTWDPFGVPDHVIVKSKSGEVLYDSGCKGNDKLGSPEPIKIPLPKEGMVINIINTCETPDNKGSSWNLRIQCSEPAEGLCKEPREELIRLVKREVEMTKNLIDANKLQQQCYFYIDKDILGDLLRDGMIEEESAPMTNGLCDSTDRACSSGINLNGSQDRNKRGIATILPYREASQEAFNCPERKDVEDSLFKTVSYAYCKTGWRRLGLQDVQPE